MPDFSNHAFAWLSIASIVIVAGSTLALPFLILRLPEDHFAKHEESEGDEKPRVSVKTIARNVLGVALFVTGVVMLVVPGPGVMMILAALTVMDFPGRKRLERRLVSTGPVLHAMNRLRAWGKKPPLRLDDAPGEASSANGAG